MRINCFIESIINNSGDIVLNKKNSHHLKNVLRVKADQNVTLFNGRGDVFISVVKAINNNEIHEIKSEIILQPGPASITDGVELVHEIFNNWNKRNIVS